MTRKKRSERGCWVVTPPHQIEQPRPKWSPSHIKTVGLPRDSDSVTLILSHNVIEGWKTMQLQSVGNGVLQ